MEIEVVKDNCKYRDVICPNCSSELRVKKNTINYYYHLGYRKADAICPCCNRNFTFKQ